MEDIDIVKKVKSGDTDAFREIIGKYKKVVFNHARSFLRNTQEAEDACQEIFISIYNNIRKFRGDSKFSTWVYRITVNTCKNKLKQLKRQRARIAEEAYEQGDEELDRRITNIREKEEKEPDNIFAGENVKDIVLKRVS
ncbi:MAG TPA: RNA polymerase sigma factor, partial [Candidatus Goldiibacteriota bacterium]|nr:RNA polymerase sigma factor [Candidatus Goldiibacteriota bacterium]